MKVILNQDISKLGKRGDIVEVADSYGVNVLIKSGKGTQATSSEITKRKQAVASKEYKKELAKSTFLKLIHDIGPSPVPITELKHKDGQLFASVTEAHITDAIFKLTGISISPKQIHIASTIKRIGEHKVEIKEGEKHAELRIVVS